MQAQIIHLRLNGEDPATPQQTATEVKDDRTPHDLQEYTFDDKIPTRELTKRASEQLAKLKIHHAIVNNGAVIKIGHVAYYPTTQTMNLDGQKKYRERGFDFLLEVLIKERLYRPK